ncbi:hypothetical protein PAXINDRAFT_68114, partial [Paxillus involutus ATCC 200175]
CVILFINSIIWNGNVINLAPVVWCDASAHLSSLRPDKDDVSRSCTYEGISPMVVKQKSRDLYIDLAIGLGFPCFIMALQYVVQGHRFNIIEQTGCFPATYDTVPSLIMWPVVIGLISAVLARWGFMNWGLLSHSSPFNMSIDG